MRIKYLASFAGPGTFIASGEVHEVDDAEAGRLIAAGFAEAAVPGVAEIETAAFAGAPENRLRVPRKRGPAVAPREKE